MGMNMNMLREKFLKEDKKVTEDNDKDIQMMESFVHVECKEYKAHGSCNHLTDLVEYLSKKPSEEAAKKHLELANLDDYHHKECTLFNKYKMCNHLEKLLYSILDGEIEVTGIQIDKKQTVEQTKSTTEEEEDLKFEDFVHKDCQEYRKYGACNHMNEIFLFVATNPPDDTLEIYLDGADLGSYHHSNCAEFQSAG